MYVFVGVDGGCVLFGKWLLFGYGVVCVYWVLVVYVGFGVRYCYVVEWLCVVCYVGGWYVCLGDVCLVDWFVGVFWCCCVVVGVVCVG